MFRARHVSDRLKRLATAFPAIAVTGARQVGKTTLVEHLFGDTHDIIVLDPVTDVGNARADPDLFLDNHPPPLVIDEVQHAPGLVAAIKRRIDRDRTPGAWILTGSQQWEVMRSISESHTTIGTFRFTSRELYACDEAGEVQQELTLEQALWAWATAATSPLVVDGAPVVEAPSLTWRDRPDCTSAIDAACEGVDTGGACGSVDVHCAPVPADALLLCTAGDDDPLLACVGVEPGGACGPGTCEPNPDQVWLCPTSPTPYAACNAAGFDPATDPCVPAQPKTCSPTGRCAPACLSSVAAVGNAVCNAYADSPGGDCQVCTDCSGSELPGHCR